MNPTLRLLDGPGGGAEAGILAPNSEPPAEIVYTCWVSNTGFQQFRYRRTGEQVGPGGYVDKILYLYDPGPVLFDPRMELRVATGEVSLLSDDPWWIPGERVSLGWPDIFDERARREEKIERYRGRHRQPWWHRVTRYAARVLRDLWRGTQDGIRWLLRICL